MNGQAIIRKRLSETDNLRNLRKQEAPVAGHSGFEASLPDGGDTFGEVVEDVAAGDTAAGGEEAADDAGDVVAQAELLRLVDALAFDAKAEATDAWYDDGVAVGELHLQGVLQVGDHGYYGGVVVAVSQE